MQKLTTVPVRCRSCNRSKGLTATAVGRKTLVQCSCGWQASVNPDAPVDTHGALIVPEARALVH